MVTFPHCRIVASSHRRIVASSHRRIVASSHRRIVASSHRRIVASSHRRIVASSHRRIVASSHRRNVASSHRRIVTFGCDCSRLAMAGSNLVIPLVIWGHEAPTHCVSSILLTPDQKHLVTGCYDGQLCVWDVLDDWQVKKRHSPW